jgi:hypothetical protein
MSKDLGNVPEDIRNRVNIETSTEPLRKWHKAAARTESLDAFRELLHNELL